MYDSTSASAIPLDATMVAGYVDGWYRWSAADWARFPNAIHVPIACFPTTNAGTVLDVESGCSLPGDAPSWTLRRRAAAVDPTVYVNRSNWAAVKQAFIQQGVAEPHYWLAAYDNIAEIPAGTVAKQYADSAMAGGHYDLSAVADYWPGVDSSNPNATAGSEVIAGGIMTPQEEAQLLADTHNTATEVTSGAGFRVLVKGLSDKLDALSAELLQGPQGDGVRMKFSTLGGAVLDIQSKVTDLETKLAQLPAGTVDLTPLTTAITALTTKLSGLTLKAQ